MSNFLSRVVSLPRLGLGVSTEYGAIHVDGALDPRLLRAANASHAAFLEVGVEVARGLDELAVSWAASGWPTTYHFLDVNLDEPADFDPDWLVQVRQLVDTLRPAWMCGDAGLWHLGRRDRGHMLLLPPILEPEAIGPMADGIAALRDAVGVEVLPENPPGTAFPGRLHLLDFFARLAEEADTGLLIDCAHLAMTQRAKHLSPLTGLDGFPMDRVVELHIAGGTVRDHKGLPWIEDDHGAHVLDDTWAIAQAFIEGAPNLKAIIIECERNQMAAVQPLFDEAIRRWTRP